MLTLTKENCFRRPGPGRILDPIRTTAMCQALSETSQFHEELLKEKCFGRPGPGRILNSR